jgi:hypothetical protein
MTAPEINPRLANSNHSNNRLASAKLTVKRFVFLIHRAIAAILVAFEEGPGQTRGHPGLRCRQKQPIGRE